VLKLIKAKLLTYGKPNKLNSITPMIEALRWGHLLVLSPNQ